MSFGGEATAKAEFADEDAGVGVEIKAGVDAECSPNRDSSREGGGVLLFAGGVRGSNKFSRLSCAAVPELSDRSGISTMLWVCSSCSCLEATRLVVLELGFDEGVLTGVLDLLPSPSSIASGGGGGG